MGHKRRLRRKEKRVAEGIIKMLGKDAAAHYPGFQATLNSLRLWRRVSFAIKLVCKRF